MTRRPRYDATLTGRLKEFEAALASLLAEASFPEPRTTPLRAASGAGAAPEQIAAPPTSGAGLPGPGAALDPGELALLQELAPELSTWSDRLDQADDPTRGFALAQAAAVRAQTLGERIRSYLDSIGPSHRLGSPVASLLEFLAKLTHNAVARMQEFAAALDVHSFSVTISSTPPGVSVTFNFGAPPS